MKVKGVPFSKVKAKALQNPKVLEAYLEARREEELQELLSNMRAKAGLNSTQVAERMGISQPAVNRLEKNASKASIHSLERYATACGVTLKISI
ncbi:helix-turn-helix domain-containing protein [Xenorhabdus thuongxuanensis]|uniref:Transcriptional regulator n=1 Tax=Xenorhabdus thuongxuanensis TaxID=1873484 RepID=A0A1Q5THS4_9GAMM|nr:helix-turn-helix transcriptional regulator [Xenorhabdus thuongxuanensis]OKO99771.1 transcriptional regulator [Xenorhabdus thuongxuanensis]